MNVNPLQLIAMLKNGSNPEQLMLSILQQRAGNNPLMRNLISLAKQHDYKGVEQIARNMFKEKGLDYDEEFNAFKNHWGFK